MNPQAGLIEEAYIMTSEGSAEMERWNFEKKQHMWLSSGEDGGVAAMLMQGGGSGGCVSCCQASMLSDDAAQAGSLLRPCPHLLW